VVGNHDRQKGGSGKRHAIDILSEVHAAYEIYVSDHIEALCTDDVCVVTLPWLYADEISLEDVGQQLDDALATVPAGRPRVLLGHCEVEGALYNDNYVVPFSVGGSGLVYPLSLFTDGAFDMTLLGHVHKNQVLDATWNVAYIGSLERVTWAERRDPKGFITAKLTPGPADGSVRCYVDWKFHNSLAKSMVEISVDWPRIETLKDWPVDDAIVRVTVMCEDYVGRDTVVSAVHAALQGDYLLDEVYILGRDRIERPTFVGKDLEAKNVMELVEMYLRQQRPDDDEWVSSRLTTAREIIEGEQE
jgi:DNA repair exonuclease SbcCD nuclease subunit